MSDEEELSDEFDKEKIYYEKSDADPTNDEGSENESNGEEDSEDFQDESVEDEDDDADGEEDFVVDSEEVAA